MRLKNLVGQKFGRLTVLERAENKGKQPRWLCRCDCGNEVIVRGADLTRGHTSSCGCLKKEIHSTHGMTHSQIYRTWNNIKNRCFNQSNKDYKEYGARGITMYDPWIHDFQAFCNYVSRLEHFGETGYTLDRIDNDGNYEPGNLHYADAKTQGRNRRTNIIVKYNGVEMTLAEAAEKSGISYGTLQHRYHVGDRGERLFRLAKKYRK